MAEIINSSFRMHTGFQTRLVKGDRAVFYRGMGLMKIQRGVENLKFDNLKNVTSYGEFILVVPYMAAAAELSYQYLCLDDQQIVIEFCKPRKKEKKKQ